MTPVRPCLPGLPSPRRGVTSKDRSSQCSWLIANQSNLYRPKSYSTPALCFSSHSFSKAVPSISSGGRSLSSHFGIHHVALPMRNMVAGTSDMRIKKASKKTETASAKTRSEEHTSELQSRFDLVCRLLLA